jgi:hypothetical protein
LQTIKQPPDAVDALSVRGPDAFSRPARPVRSPAEAECALGQVVVIKDGPVSEFRPGVPDLRDDRRRAVGIGGEDGSIARTAEDALDNDEFGAYICGTQHELGG